MAKTRTPCPKHTTGSGPCYCQYHKDNNTLYQPPTDVKDCLSKIYTILRGRIPSEITQGQAARVRQVNVGFIRDRIPGLSSDNVSRAFETMKNLRG